MTTSGVLCSLTWSFTLSHSSYRDWMYFPFLWILECFSMILIIIRGLHLPVCLLDLHLKSPECIHLCHLGNQLSCYKIKYKDRPHGGATCDISVSTKVPCKCSQHSIVRETGKRRTTVLSPHSQQYWQERSMLFRLQYCGISLLCIMK